MKSMTLNKFLRETFSEEADNKYKRIKKMQTVVIVKTGWV